MKAVKNEKLINFVDSIRQNRELWDKEYAGYYKNRKRKVEIWEKLAKQHHFPDFKAARGKWTNMREQYIRHRTAGTGTSWPYMQAMSFHQGRIIKPLKKSKNLRRSKIAVSGGTIKIKPMAEEKEEANCNNGPQMTPNLAIVKKEPQHDQNVAHQQNASSGEFLPASRTSARRAYVPRKGFVKRKILRCAICRAPYWLERFLRAHLKQQHSLLNAQSPHFDCTPYTIVESPLQYLDGHAGPNQQLEYIYGQQQPAEHQPNIGTASSSSSLAAQNLPSISLEAVGQQFDDPTTSSNSNNSYGQQPSPATHLGEEEETTGEDVVCCSFCLDNVLLEDMCDHLNTHGLPELHKDEIWAFIREPPKGQQSPLSTYEEGRKEKRQAEGGGTGEKKVRKELYRIVLPQEAVRRSPRKKVATRGGEQPDGEEEQHENGPELQPTTVKEEEGDPPEKEPTTAVSTTKQHRRRRRHSPLMPSSVTATNSSSASAPTPDIVEKMRKGKDGEMFRIVVIDDLYL